MMYLCMKSISVTKYSFSFAFFLAFLATNAAFGQTKLVWYTWDEAVALQQKTPKKVMVDMYTDWCGWCKRMDATTFSDSTVVAYLQENFYPVKFDAEQKAPLVFSGYTFKYIEPQAGQGRGVHELAASLLDNKLGYPSIVYLTPDYQRILISPGYKEVVGMMQELRFVREDIYQVKSFEDYKAGK
jgi:uncharacterized protein YyaL (SSP411 family)